MTSLPRRPWTFLIAAGAGVVALLAATVEWWPRLLPVCGFHQLTGLHCPGCGGTRCATRLLGGDIAGAFAMNAMVMVLGIAWGGYFLHAAWGELRGKGLCPVSPAWVWTTGALVLVFWVLRNLPWWPFTLLAPS